MTKEEQEEKEVEQEETQVDETPMLSRLAEDQDRAEENEIAESVRATRPMMLSRMSGAEEEMSASLKRLPMKLEITGVSELMSEMPSEIRVQAVERTQTLPAELPSTLNVERRGAGASQITAEAAKEGENIKDHRVSGVMEKLTKTEAQQK